MSKTIKPFCIIVFMVYNRMRFYFMGIIFGDCSLLFGNQDLDFCKCQDLDLMD